MKADIEALNKQSLPCSWYPVLQSSQLRKGMTRAIQLDGNELVIFRGSSGKPGVIQRYCCHFGADLADATVQADQIVCPMHGWQFNSCGQRQPRNPEFPADPITGALFCLEAFGLIFVYCGEQAAAFELPRFDYGTEVYSKPIVLKLDAEHYLPALNTFDLQHYEKFHGRRFIEPAVIEATASGCLRIGYKAEIVGQGWMDRILTHLSGTTTDIEIECWGGNILKMQNLGTGYCAIIASTPHSRYDTTIYIVVVRQAKAGQMALMRHIEMSIARILVRQFLKPDFTVLNAMRPDRGWMLDSHDHGLVQFLKYWRQLPRWTGFEVRRRDLASFN